MKQDLLENYLQYLDEVGAANAALDAVYSGMRQGGFWSLIIIPGAFAAWRAANAAFSGAVRKCGVLKQGKGRDACVARERIKALQQKINIMNSSKGNCSKTKNPKECLEKISIELEKSNINLRREQDKLRTTLGESTDLNEVSIGGIAKGAGGFGAMIIGSMIIDKALFLTLRTAQALYSNAARKCGPYKEGPERDICMSKFKLAALLQQKSVYIKVLSACSRQSNKEACIDKVKKKIESIDRKIQIEKDSIESSSNELNAQKREEEFKSAQKNG